MKNLILAAIAATMMPVLAHATSIQEIRTTQVMQCVDKKSGSELEACVSDVIEWTLNNGAHEATKEITSHIENVTGVNTINGGYEIKAAKQQLHIALANTVSKQEVMKLERELHKARADLKQWQGWLNYWQPHAQNLEKHLRRAEDRIRELERQLDFHKSGGHWNPQNW